MNSEPYEKFFTSGARSAGSRIYKDAKVSFSKPSALEITAYVKPNLKVSLKLESIQSININTDCSCTNSKKGQLCKHIWATFLAVLEKSPDFFDSVKDVIKKEAFSKVATPLSEAQINAKASFKLKQEDYRKQQYQKQKTRAKAYKNKKNKSFETGPTYPTSVQLALEYFSNNGFLFEDSLNENSILIARKKLARIFHPDVGGSHAESLELNSNSEVLLKYVSKL